MRAFSLGRPRVADLPGRQPGHPRPQRRRSAAYCSGLGQVGLGVLVGGVAGRLGRPVDEVQHAGLERLGRDQPQRDRGLALVEQPHALADGDRVHQQVQLVEQAGGQQLADDGDRAAHARCSSPGSFFSAVTASTRSPSSCSEFRQVNSSFWFDTTILRASPSVLAKSASSSPAASRSGHAPAKLS